MSRVPIPVVSEQEGAEERSAEENPASVQFPRGKAKLRSEQPEAVLAQSSSVHKAQPCSQATTNPPTGICQVVWQEPHCLPKQQGPLSMRETQTGDLEIEGATD